MAEIDLKAYIARALDLESAIYTQRKLMAAHDKLIQEQRPIKPSKRILEEPVKPDPNDYQVFRTKSTGFHFFIALMILAGIIGVCGLFLGMVIRGLICLGIGVCGVACLYSELDEKRRNDAFEQLRKNAYKEDCEAYSKQIEQYKKDIVISDEAYQASLAEYEANVNNYDNAASSMKSRHTSALAELENALKVHYEIDVVFPKYRNFVAISAINEYLMSGRCFELEGPNGAYNLYEMELRQNIVIDQLATIIDNLEQIRNNQFSLYRELVRANDTVDQIIHELRDLKDTTKLAAYFAGVSAMAAVSPKYYKGFIY